MLVTPNCFNHICIAEGGHCNKSQPMLPYASWKVIPSEKPDTIGNSVGSIGVTNAFSTRGGGRVVISADSVIMLGSLVKIQANGMQQGGSTTLSNGGSAGYIYIKTFNDYLPNQISAGSVITANGGGGVSGGFGASGGSILFDNFNIPKD